MNKFNQLLSEINNTISDPQSEDEINKQNTTGKPYTVIVTNKKGIDIDPIIVFDQDKEKAMEIAYKRAVNEYSHYGGTSDTWVQIFDPEGQKIADGWKSKVLGKFSDIGYIANKIAKKFHGRRTEQN